MVPIRRSFRKKRSAPPPRQLPGVPRACHAGQVVGVRVSPGFMTCSVTLGALSLSARWKPAPAARPRTTALCAWWTGRACVTPGH